MTDPNGDLPVLLRDLTVPQLRDFYRVATIEVGADEATTYADDELFAEATAFLETLMWQLRRAEHVRGERPQSAPSVHRP